MKRYSNIASYIKSLPCRLLVAVLVTTLAAGDLIPVVASAAPVAQTSSKKSRKKSRSGTTASKSSKKSTSKSSGKSTNKSSTKSSGKKRRQQTSAKPETSAELRCRQENAQREIAETKEEIRRNDASIKKSLSELSKIEGDIAVSTKEVGKLRGQVNGLQKQITTLTTRIDEQNAKLDKLRAEYLKAVKKMRGSRKRNSQLAFVFSSDGLSQAERRMRYLKEFARWRDNQTEEINKTVAQLKVENEKLQRAKADYDVMLGRQETVQKRLVGQQQEQNRIVADLRANGAALNSHLARKQAEVNELRNRVAALIAAEERKAAEERRKREAAEAAEREAERRREEERARQEEARQLAEEQEEEQAKDKKSDKKKDKKQDKKQDKKTETKKTEKVDKSEKKQDKKTEKKQPSKTGGKDYASARKRKPRAGAASSSSSGGSGSSSAVSKPAASSAGGFASMQGRLPKPVSGSFRITSPFGRHSLPDLPDVVYDNPGIDAEVAPGAAAQAVYAGKVSGVYMIPGFSTVVIVNHGDYYTVYGNIASASVKVGDTVKQGDTVGRLAADPDNPNVSTIHFEVWKNRDKLNPASWIR